MLTVIHRNITLSVLKLQGGWGDPTPLVLQQASLDSEKKWIEGAWFGANCCLFISSVIKYWHAFELPGSRRNCPYSYVFPYPVGASNTSIRSGFLGYYFNRCIPYHGYHNNVDDHSIINRFRCSDDNDDVEVCWAHDALTSRVDVWPRGVGVVTGWRGRWSVGVAVDPRLFIRRTTARKFRRNFQKRLFSLNQTIKITETQRFSYMEFITIRN